MIGEAALKYKFLEMALDYLIESIVVNFIQFSRLELKPGDTFSIIKFRDPEWKDDDEDYYQCTIRKIYLKMGQEHIVFAFNDAKFSGSGIAAGLETRFMEFIK